MLTLYVKTGCPFAAMVIHKLEELGAAFEEKNVEDSRVSDELIARGGKHQTPYLFDAECNIGVYESSDIVEYLEKRFSAGDSKTQASVPDVCPTE